VGWTRKHRSAIRDRHPYGDEPQASPAVACGSSDSKIESWHAVFELSCRFAVVDFSCVIFIPVEFNTARPGRRKNPISPSGSGPCPFQDNTATIYTIANTGAMLIFGQNRSID
jgi:hypothetical protein